MRPQGSPCAALKRRRHAGRARPISRHGQVFVRHCKRLRDIELTVYIWYAVTGCARPRAAAGLTVTACKHFLRTHVWL